MGRSEENLMRPWCRRRLSQWRARESTASRGFKLESPCAWTAQQQPVSLHPTPQGQLMPLNTARYRVAWLSTRMQRSQPRLLLPTGPRQPAALQLPV